MVCTMGRGPFCLIPDVTQSAQEYTSKDLWQQVKSTVRSIEHDDGVLIFDDTIQEKAWTDESDLTCDYDVITTTYKKRWQVEVFHKPLKSNANLAKSPTRTLRTQSNHVFMAIYATFKLECLGIANKLNPFALCRKLLINASRSAYAQLQLFRAAA
jgi:hypothetical protein